MKRKLLFLLPFLLLPLLMAASLFTGSSQLAAAEVWGVLTGNAAAAHDMARLIVVEVRLPQMLTAMAAGASLAVAGLLLQTVFANPLADPSLLGVNGGASLGVAVAMLLMGGSVAVGGAALGGFLLMVTAASVGAAVVVGLLLLASAAMPGRLMLLITGVMVSFVTGALVALLGFRASAAGLQNFVVWGMGSFSGLTLHRLPPVLLLAAVGLAGGLALCKPLDAMLLGDEYARSAGQPVRRSRLLALLVSGGLCALVTAVCGPVGFLGLAVPHAARLVLRTSSHRLLIPSAIVWGACTALLCQLLASLPVGGGPLPVNVITPFFGVPVVFYILLRRRE